MKNICDLCGLFLSISVVWSSFICTAAWAIIPAFTARYDIYQGEMRLGEAQLKLEYPHTGQAVYTTHIKPNSFLSWLVKPVIELGRWDEQGDQLKPLMYYFDSGKTTTREWVSFDWQKGIVQDSGAKPWLLPLSSDILDFASVRFALLRDLATGRPELNYTIADAGKLKPYQFTRHGEATITLPLGTFKTLRIERLHKSRLTVLWVAANLHYLPVQVEQHRNGNLLFQLRLQHIAFETVYREKQPQ